MFDFSDKVVLITGAFGGIGSEIASQLYSKGARVALLSRTKLFDKRITDKMPEKDRVLVVVGDLLFQNDVNKIIKITQKKYKRIDILINCAGTNIRKKLGEYTSEDWDQVMNLNLKSTFLLMSKVAEIMKKRRSGKIINISSIQGVVYWKVGEWNLSPYCASKAGLISLTKTFALDLATYGITVNAVCPSVVKGKWAEKTLKNRKIYKDVISRTPLGRIATASDVAGSVMFLASPLADFITGQAILVDGGWTIQ